MRTYRTCFLRASKIRLMTALGLFLAAALLWQLQGLREDVALTARISPRILRFHVLADSNAPSDQAVKRKLKSRLLELIYEGLEESSSTAEGSHSTAAAPAADISLPTAGKAAVLSYLNASQPALTKAAEDFLHSIGCTAPVAITTDRSWFPEKYYGSLTLPSGFYEELRVTIGSGRGHNWWCILYPKVCITKDAVAAVPESSLKEFESLLTEKDFRKLQAQRPDLKIHIGFRTANAVRRLFTARKATAPAPQAH